jgi:two-component system OmpR family response regulator
MIKIFWVEDQQHWIDKFRPLLQSTRFDGGEETPLNNAEFNRLETFKQQQAALARISQTDDSDAPHIAILDASLNGDDDGGFSVSKALLKKWPALPIVFLSEHSGTGIEQKAFEEGVTQDFIAKNQRNIEGVLLWRIKALLKSVLAVSPKSEVLTSGDLTIDLVSWEVCWKGNVLMNPANAKRPLAPTPRKMLRFLVEASPRPLTTMQMADKLDADLEKFSYANYRQHIKTLRKSLALAHGDEQAFMDICRNGEGVVTFGADGAYLWKAPVKSGG